MKKTFKNCTTLLLLLALLTTINPIVPTPQPEDTESGISVLGDDDSNSPEDLIKNC